MMEKEDFHAYFSGNSTLDEEKKLLDWVEASPTNYQTFLKERKAWELFLLNAESEEEVVVHRPKNTLLLWKTVAAASLIGFMLTWFAWFSATSEKEYRLHTVIVPAGQRVQLKLADGTEVWLNAKTTFSYPESFDSDQRLVYLDGEAYFKVHADPQKKFIVEAGNYAVQALGTTFHVQAYSNKPGFFEASLVEGMVCVKPSKKEHGDVVLKPDENLVIKDGIQQIKPIGSLDRFRWRDGLICVNDMPFGILLEKFSTCYDVQIQVLNQQVYDYQFTGKFRMSDGIDYALKVLQKDLPFDYSRKDTVITVY